MDRIQFISLILFLFIAVIGIWLRPDLMGFDSYASLECIRGNCSFLTYQPLAVMVLQLIPDNLFLIKSILFFCFALTVFALFLIARHLFSERIAWISTLALLGLSPLLIFWGGTFENEVFAYPLIFFSFYMVLQPKIEAKALSLILSLLACGFWAGSIYFLPVLGLFWWPNMLSFVVILFFEWENFLDFLLPTSVLESRLFAAFLDLFLLIFAIPFLFREKDRRLWVGFFLILLFVAIQGKFVMLLMPFLLVGVGKAIELIDSKGFHAENAILALFFFIICWNVAFLMQQPTQSDWKIIDSTVKLSQDTNYPIINDWSYGYWLTNKGITTKYRGGYPEPDYQNQQRPFIAITSQDLNCDLREKDESLTKVTKQFICK